MDWSIRRIQRIKQLNQAASYLEIGVELGTTFLNVDIETKDGVDPNFGFDWRSWSSDTVRLFPLASDDFWVSGQAKVYDIIMIDGLHTFEQTFRDVLCSLRFSHDQTVWLIDDTMPSDVFSAIPDQARALNERRKMNNSSLDWHGDVFKVVMAIHDFIPTLDYATIVGSGNPQTLVWNSKRGSFAPRFNSFEAISRLTFFDIEPNLGVFRLCDEDEAFRRLQSTLWTA